MSIKNSSKSLIFLFFFLNLFLLFFLITISSQPYSDNNQIPITGGKWILLHQSIGISAMHMQLLNNNKIVIFDRTDFGRSNLSLPAGHCRYDPNDVALKTDCTAHSLIYDVFSNKFQPLMVQTDTWCSSGSVLPNGTLVQTGGYNDGDRNVRTISPCNSNSSSNNINDDDEYILDPQCDWIELPSYLSVRRWYASNQALPDGRVIIVGGRRVYSYEFYPRTKPINQSGPSDFFLNFLKETRDFYDENNLYPFLHLLPDGNLFIFANRRSILFDYQSNRILKEFPQIPGPDKRNYPSTGSSVLLPIQLNGTQALPEVEVMVCGGAPPGAFLQAHQGVFLGASKSCGRLRLTDPNPNWFVEEMPMGRVMSDMILLPTGDVLIINGAANGTAGWESAVNPVLYPVLYSTYEPDPGKRFNVLNPSPIPRLYHSAAVLVADGRILVGGSNPHRLYNFTDVTYPTELSLEAFSPHYLSPEYSYIRSSIISVGPTSTLLVYQQVFTVTFFLPSYNPENDISVMMLSPPFTTHSFGMNQRLLRLKVVSFLQMATSVYQVSVIAPATSAIAPQGYYLLFVVYVGVPSEGVWLAISE